MSDDLGKFVGSSEAMDLAKLLEAIQERMAAGDTHAMVQLYERGSMIKFGVLRTEEGDNGQA